MMFIRKLFAIKLIVVSAIISACSDSQNSIDARLEKEVIRAVSEKLEEVFSHSGSPVQICNSVKDAKVVRETSKYGTASRVLNNSWDAHGITLDKPIPAGLFVVEYVCVHEPTRTKTREYASVFLAINEEFGQLECRKVGFETSKTNNAFIDSTVRELSRKCGFKESAK